jgi:hypothetical protein
MATIRIDEINQGSFDYARYIEDYFEPMDITEEQKDERKKASRDFRDFLLFLFTLLAVQDEFSTIDWAYFEAEFVIEFERNALNYARDTELLQEFIRKKAEDFTNITREHYGEDSYWTSDERATFEAVNDANAVLGYEELDEAIENGYKYKTWKTELDARVRKDHRSMEGKKVKIDDYFVLPDCMMLMPHDDVNGTPKQVENCRCVCKYTRE